MQRHTDSSMKYLHRNSLIRRICANRQVYMMLLPNLVLFFALSIYPITWVFRYMFFQYDKLHTPVFIGLENFIRVFTRDAYFWKTVLNTFIYVSGKLLLTLPLSLSLALILNRRFRGSGIVRSVIFMPTIMSAAVMALIFYLLLNPYSGEINRVLQKLDIIKQPINWLSYQNAMFSVIIVGVWGAVGNYMIYFLAGLQTIPLEIYESAKLDGITPWKKLRCITLPMLAPVMKTVVMLAITSSFQDIQSIMVLTGGGPNGASEVMFLYTYRMFFPISTGTQSVSQFGYGAALSLISAIIIGSVTCLYLAMTRRLDEIY